MDKDWIAIYSAVGPEAFIIKGRLEAEGIPVMLKQEAIGKIYGLTVDGLGEIKVCVPTLFKEEALKVISVKGEKKP